MIKTRRDVLIGGLAAFASAAGAAPAWAATGGKSYFAGTAVDNGVTYRLTNFSKIDKKWHKQVVKYFSSEPPGIARASNGMAAPTSTARRYGRNGRRRRR
jgi:hypothetical protein